MEKQNSENEVFVVRWGILMVQNSMPIKMIRKKIARTLFK